MFEPSGSAAKDYSGNAYNGAYTGVSLAESQPPFLCPYFDGANDYMNFYSYALNTAWNRDERTFACWLKVYNAGVWTDAINRMVMYLGTTDYQQTVLIRKSTAANTLYFRVDQGGIYKTINHTISSTGWIHVAVTFSYSGNAMKVYVNGAQSGATQTGYTNPASATNLTTGECCIGSQTITPLQAWYGHLAYACIFNRALSATEIANLYAWGV